MEQLLRFVTFIDWAVLRDQKLAVQQCIGDDDELLTGLLNLLDALQDAAVDDGIATDSEVFGPMLDEHNYPTNQQRNVCANCDD